jgi:hypothetical protein
MAPRASALLAILILRMRVSRLGVLIAVRRVALPAIVGPGPLPLLPLVRCRTPVGTSGDRAGKSAALPDAGGRGRAALSLHPSRWRQERTAVVVAIS